MRWFRWGDTPETGTQGVPKTPNPWYITFVLNQQTMTTYRVIGFGTNEHGFFNEYAHCGSIGYACGFYNGHLQDPEMDGVVLIRVNHEDWEVIQESGTIPYSVSCGPGGNFKVERAVDMVLV